MAEKEGEVGVFISYIHENKEKVHRLPEDLRRSGIKVWLDEDKIKPGQFWKDVIRDAIQGGSFFIACFSKEYNERNRSHMNEELTLAIDELRKRPNNRVWFISVLLSGEVPNRPISDGVTLRDIQWVDLRQDQDWDNGIRKILNVVAPKEDEKKKFIIDMLNRFNPDTRNKIINLEEVEVQIFERHLNEFLKIVEYLTQNELFDVKRPEERVSGIGPKGSWMGFILIPLKNFRDIISDPNLELKI